MSSQGGRGSLHPVSGPGPGGDGGPGGEAGGLAAGVRQDPGAEAGDGGPQRGRPPRRHDAHLGLVRQPRKGGRRGIQGGGASLR